MVLDEIYTFGMKVVLDELVFYRSTVGCGKRTTAGCERHKRRLVGAMCNIVVVDGMGQLLCDVGFCMELPLW